MEIGKVKNVSQVEDKELPSPAEATVETHVELSEPINA